MMAMGLRDRVEMPVLMKEMRTRMRGGRAQWLLLAPALVSAAVGVITLLLTWANLDTSNPSELMQGMAVSGRILFYVMLGLQALLCLLLAPALTAGAITIEREQQTLEWLLLTRLTGGQIVVGKLLSSLSFLLLLLLTAMPVTALTFFMGGIDARQFFWGYALLFATATLFGAIGLWCSAIFRKTVFAIIVAYLLCAAWYFLLPGVTIFGGIFSHDIEDLLVYVVAFAAAFGVIYGLMFLADRLYQRFNRRARVIKAQWLRATIAAVLSLPVAALAPGTARELLSAFGLSPGSEWMMLLFSGNPLAAMVVVALTQELTSFASQLIPLIMPIATLVIELAVAFLLLWGAVLRVRGMAREG